ncbi:glycyl radical enzyme family protein [Thermus sediminis]|uniref:hypothetical protein n=1 Tax=Thermus sediminis TaxID=1761908 RepID=UPI000E3C96B5|nr:hypothetical protein [Thermus sediminis]
MPRRPHLEAEAERLALDFLGGELRASVFPGRYGLGDQEGIPEATPEEALTLTPSDAHPELSDSLQAKTGPARSRVRRANISLGATEAFLGAALADKPRGLRFPTPKEEIRAEEAWEAPVAAAWEGAEPGLPFWDPIRTWTKARYGGMEVVGVSVCGEVPMEAYRACNHADQSTSSTATPPRETPKEVGERFFLTAFREGSRVEVTEPLLPLGACTFCQTA